MAATSTAPMPLELAVGELVATLRHRGLPSARNLLVTVFGDAVASSGAGIPVQALARLLEGVGVNDRLVRTSLTRLVRDAILRNEKVGRRSIYSIDPSAVALFDRAEARIYHHSETEWDGRWTIAVVDPTASTAGQRTALRRELDWLGMGTVTPNVLASSNVAAEQVTALLERVGGDHQVLVTRGAVSDGAMTMSDAEIARRCAPTDELSDRYAEIIDWFTPVAVALDATQAAGDDLSPQHCWTARLLLIATFRRVALADPSLPQRLLPPSWQGGSARDLVGSLYVRLHRHAETWLADVCSDPDGAWAPGHTSADRFTNITT